MIGLSQDQPLGATPTPPATDKPDDSSFPPMKNGDKPPRPEEEEIKEKLADLDIKPPAKTPPPELSGKPKKTKVVMAVLALLFMVASIPAAVYLVQQRQEIRKEALQDQYQCLDSCDNRVCEAGDEGYQWCSKSVPCRCDGPGQASQLSYTQWCDGNNTMECRESTPGNCGAVTVAGNPQGCVGGGGGVGGGGDCPGTPCEGQTSQVVRQKPDDDKKVDLLASSVSSTYIFYCDNLSPTCDKNVCALRCDNNNRLFWKIVDGMVKNLCDYEKYVTYQGQQVPCECFAWQVDWMDSSNNLLGWRMRDEAIPLEECLTRPEPEFVCVDLSSTEETNGGITLSCSGAGIGGATIDHFDFQYRRTGESWIDLGQQTNLGTEKPLGMDSKIGFLTIKPDTITAGDWEARCRTCLDPAGNQCSPWHEP